MRIATRSITHLWCAMIVAAPLIATASGEERNPAMTDSSSAATAAVTLGAGCFWCVEAVFQRIEGVLSVTPGYAGGSTENPTYEAVCSGRTGHAEVARIEFDPSRVGFADLLAVFWKSHDPTTPDRQGADVGSQYRSVIFYHDPEQKRIAEESRRAVQASGLFADPIVTEISPLPAFYPAENYHQDYYDQNRDAPYCRYVIQPKLRKLGLE